MRTALDQNLELLRQGLDLLERIDDDTYRAADDPAEAGSGVGPHLRHCVDAYECLLCGLGQGRVDYDARRRDAGVESDRRAGVAALDELAANLSLLADRDPDTELRVQADTPADAPGAWSRSTLRRELQFLVGHTVHHYALVAMILRRRGIEPGRDFGVAPSTLRHWARRESIAR